MKVHPSGRQLELTHGDQRAVVVEVGAGLRTYTAGDRQVIDGYPADAMCPAARGQVLMPWPNRIIGGRYEFAGETHQLAITETSSATAIHGLVRWTAWAMTDVAADRVLFSHRVHPQPGYPFTVDLSVEYSLSGEGLRVAARATNAGPDRCPFGAGFHPYLTPDGATIDGTRLGLPAKRPADFAVPRPVGTDVLDTCFTDLTRGDDRLARVQFGKTTLWMDRAFEYLMVFTGDSLGPSDARRALAVEPMTCAPDAFNNGDGLIVLARGETWTGQWGISRSP